MFLCSHACTQHRSYRASVLKQENRQQPPEEIYEAGGLTSQCGVLPGTSTAPALISFAVEGPLNGDEHCVASNFKDAESRFIQSGATRCVRRSSEATWRGGTGAPVTDARTDAQPGTDVPLGKGQGSRRGDAGPSCCLSPPCTCPVFCRNFTVAAI